MYLFWTNKNWVYEFNFVHLDERGLRDSHKVSLYLTNNKDS